LFFKELRSYPNKGILPATPFASVIQNLPMRCGRRRVVILNFSFKLIAGREGIWCKFSLFRTYRALSNAPVDVLWQKLINLADVSWHPLLSSTNAPRGLIAKPGIIYQVVTRLIPIPVRIFVERVRPGELLSVRVLAIPGVEKRITYQVESTVCGSYVSYSVTLRGWLSPLIWWLVRPYMARVASELAHAAEQIAAL
jgi:hypothetical protein